MKLEQHQLLSQDQREIEREADMHAAAQTDLQVRQLQGDEAQAERAAGITAYIGTNLTSTNPQFTPFNLADPDSRAAYIRASSQPGAVKLSQDTVDKIVTARQETVARQNALLTAGALPADAKE